MDKEIQNMLNDLPNKKFAKYSDAKLESFEITSKRMKGRTVTDETKKKLSEKNSGNKISEEHKNKLSKRIISDETKQKISETKLGTKFSEEHKNKLSKAKLGKKFSEEHKKKLSERIISDETRKKLSDLNKNKKHSYETKKKMSEIRMKPIIMCTYPEMEFIREYNSIEFASIDLKLNRNYISKRLLGMIKNPGNFTFKYKD